MTTPQVDLDLIEQIQRGGAALHQLPTRHEVRRHDFVETNSPGRSKRTTTRCATSPPIFTFRSCETLCWFCGRTAVITLNHDEGKGYYMSASVASRAAGETHQPEAQSRSAALWRRFAHVPSARRHPLPRRNHSRLHASPDFAKRAGRLIHGGSRATAGRLAGCGRLLGARALRDPRGVLERYPELQSPRSAVRQFGARVAVIYRRSRGAPVRCLLPSLRPNNRGADQRDYPQVGVPGRRPLAVATRARARRRLLCLTSAGRFAFVGTCAVTRDYRRRDAQMCRDPDGQDRNHYRFRVKLWRASQPRETLTWLRRTGAIRKDWHGPCVARGSAGIWSAFASINVRHSGASRPHHFRSRCGRRNGPSY